MRKLTLLTIFGVLALELQAQHTTHGEEGQPLNHVMACRVGVHFVENLPPPQIMEGIGHSDLKINTSSSLTQQYFSQGVSLLHCFWDFEAYRAFKEAIRHDSTAIMPYWGLLHTLNFTRKSEFDADKEMALNKIKTLYDSASDLELHYAKGVVDFIESNNPEGYIRKLEYIIHHNPEDVDAKLFLALMNRSGFDSGETPKPGNMYAEYLLQDLLRTNPDHYGVHHYWIHQMESKTPERALESAKRLTSMAPNSGHIVHMPGHIYYQMGMYREAHQQFVQSMKVDSAYMTQQGINEIDNWNYIHNLDYLLANCVQSGHYQRALRYAELLKAMHVVPERPQSHQRLYFHHGVIVPAFIEMRFGHWKRAADKFKAIDDPDSLYGVSAMNYKQAWTLFSEGMAAVELEDGNTAQIFLDRLDALLWRNSQKEDEKEKINPFYLSLLKPASFQLKGNIIVLKGQFEKGIATLKKAAQLEQEFGYSEPPMYPRPVLINLGEVYTSQGYYDKAEECYQRLVEKHPNSALAYQGLIEVYEAEGNQQKLSEAKSKLAQVKK